jgi:hypothetical protein
MIMWWKQFAPLRFEDTFRADRDALETVVAGVGHHNRILAKAAPKSRRGLDHLIRGHFTPNVLVMHN